MCSGITNITDTIPFVKDYIAPPIGFLSPKLAAQHSLKFPEICWSFGLVGHCLFWGQVWWGFFEGSIIICIYSCAFVFFVYMCIYMCARRGNPIPWSQSYRQFWATHPKGVLGTELEFSEEQQGLALSSPLFFCFLRQSGYVVQARPTVLDSRDLLPQPPQ